jgi:hypothetical protein
MNKHWELFPEFVRQELAAGGPDPQVALMAELVKNFGPRKKLWAIGCYCAHHCVPSAYAVAMSWTPEDAYFDSEGGNLEKWLRDHWQYLPVRPEMRSHRMPEKRAKCLQDWAKYALEWTPERTNKSYEEVWKDTEYSVKYFGRYMNIKFLEMLRVILPAPHLDMPDMRAKGSWSPRKALFMLWPDVTLLGVREDESKIALQIVDDTAHTTRQVLSEKNIIEVNMFQLQVLLCEYKEALAGGFYPGGTHDEELAYIEMVEPRFATLMDDVLEARRNIFPHHLLGELGGWKGLRQDKFQVFKGAKSGSY